MSVDDRAGFVSIRSHRSFLSCTCIRVTQNVICYSLYHDNKPCGNATKPIFSSGYRPTVKLFSPTVTNSLDFSGFICSCTLYVPYISSLVETNGSEK